MEYYGKVKGFDRIVTYCHIPVEHNRNEVPLQKASIAVPLSSFAISWPGKFQHIKSFVDALTGKATDSEVPSKAAIKVRTDNVKKTSFPPRPKANLSSSTFLFRFTSVDALLVLSAYSDLAGL